MTTEAGAGPVTPVRPAKPRRGWWAVILIVVVLIVLTAGGWVLAIASPPGTPLGPSDPGREVDVGPTLTVRVADGWEIVQQDPAALLLSNGTGLLEIYPAPTPYEDAVVVVRDYVAEVLEPSAVQVTVGDIEPLSVSSDWASARAGYQGTFGENVLEGAVTGLISASGSAAVFDASAPVGQLSSVIDDVDRMIEESTIR